MTGSLGNTTKFSSARENPVNFVREYGNTALRFYLLEIARDLLPNERIQVCWRYPLPTRKTVEIIYSEERETARTAGTMKCGSGWVCPACMQYIAARRREEIQTALERSQNEYFSVMATYTARHDAGMRLADLTGSMVKAYGGVFSGRWWAETKEEFALTGAIRAMEITYGENGWHPHFHVIMLVRRDMLEGSYNGTVSADQEIFGSPAEYCGTLQPMIEKRWLAQLAKRGLDAKSGIAVDIRSADAYIAEYVSKFGKMPQDWAVNASAYEVASGPTKTAREGNLSVLDLLFHSVDSPKMKNLFLEYAAATKGRSAIHWSKGLKAMLDIEVIRDEIAAEGIETETDRLLAEVGIANWKYAVMRGYLGQIMTYANAGNDQKLAWLLGKIDAERESTVWHIPQNDIGL